MQAHPTEQPSSVSDRPLQLILSQLKSEKLKLLQQSRLTLDARLRTLVTFVNTMGPETEALHIGSICMHGMFTSLGSVAVLFFTAGQRRLIVTSSIGCLTSHVLDLPLDTLAARAVLAVPVSYGGLGFFHPQHEAALH